MRPGDVGMPAPYGWSKVTFAKNQPQYQPLPSLRNSGPSGDVMSRWRLTWRERLLILCGRDVWLNVLTFGNVCRHCGTYTGLKPVQMWVGDPQFRTETRDAAAAQEEAACQAR
jgi:hypothetical protein